MKPPAPIRRVTVAVLSWNGRAHLEVCLPALAGQEDPGVPWDVVVLDNGSSDGTAVWLATEHPWVRRIESPVNLGFAAGANRLVAEATGDAVALLNNDTLPDRRWLAALVDALAAAPAEVAAVSGLIVDWEGTRLDFARGVMTFDGHAFQAGYKKPLAGPDAAPVPVDGADLFFACGGNLLIRREAFLAAGGFDPDYFAYLEDVDLGWRLQAGGERVLFARDAVVRHRSMATSDLLGLYNRGFLFERNAFLTACKNYDAELWPQLMPAVLLTLHARNQTLLVQGNPGGSTLTLDPYAGWIADTAKRGEEGRDLGEEKGEAGRHGSARSGLAAKLREYGLAESARRAVRKLGRKLAGIDGTAFDPRRLTVTDERSVAHLRAWTYLLAHLDEAAAKRAAVQARRRVPDREIFARFPPYLVPTYPGDERLFAGTGFRSWLPPDLPLAEATLGELMELDVL